MFVFVVFVCFTVVANLYFSFTILAQLVTHKYKSTFPYSGIFIIALTESGGLVYAPAMWCWRAASGRIRCCVSRRLTNGSFSSADVLLDVDNGSGGAAVPLAPRGARVSATRDRSETEPFVDWCRVRVAAGDGGDGCVSLAREFGRAQAGVDGGDGGAGGHVLLRASAGCSSLAGVRSVVRASAGAAGRRRQCDGAAATAAVVPVPLGTIVQSVDGQLSASLERDGDVFVAARGGGGGRGNRFFVTSTEQTPRYAERGARGERRSYTLEMRTMADVGLIGVPNAGKSTLLRQVSSARPRVANYPFTTLRPHVGVVEYSDARRLAVADIPGLIAGAHVNRGLGAAFLRHVRRCTCLVFVLDACDEPVRQLHVLRRELELYESQLSQRPAAIVANKMDASGADAGLRQLRQELPEATILPLSAKLGTNVAELLQYLRMLCDNVKMGQQQSGLEASLRVLS